MAIRANSAEWTGQHDDTPLTVPVVWGEFADAATLPAAAARLDEEEAFHRRQARTRAPEAAPIEPPDEDPRGASARTQRQLGVGTAMAATGMLAAGAVIATGGAVLPAAAALAAGATGAAGEVVGTSLEPASTGNPPPGVKAAAEAQGPMLGLRAATAELRERAERFLRESGAVRVWVQEARAGG
ncbi:hypothetical protein GCM10010964_41570 [Caldovatus sediminis]|uniref:Uncharacterized protein n=1 Tax=Caldovatus sediminis TaxID=2041189 RepID=A0A8J3EEA2_9PROT|nr:hypothetical protein [Caldovatus sediminis]GGG49983.1 hypothetical protein GCM10010964_41570 [Caldovatus sediminis]